MAWNIRVHMVTLNETKQNHIIPTTQRMGRDFRTPYAEVME